MPGGKRPLYTGWQRDATTDPDRIARYWRREPGPNIGLLCGEAFDVFDIEAAHLPALREWMRAGGHHLPETPIARSGRGGVHILVQPLGGGGRALGLGDARIGELKAAGGFIVACPSRTEGPYTWSRSPEEAAVVPAPGWLGGLVVKPRPDAELVLAALLDVSAP